MHNTRNTTSGEKMNKASEYIKKYLLFVMILLIYVGFFYFIFFSIPNIITEKKVVEVQQSNMEFQSNIKFISYRPLPACDEPFNILIYENDSKNEYILERLVSCDGYKTLTLRYINFTKVKK